MKAFWRLRDQIPGQKLIGVRWVPLVLVLLAVLPTAQARGGDTPSWSPKAAAKYLDERTEEWLNWSGATRGQKTVCLSCHTTMPLALARPALAAALGETTAARAEQRLIDNVKKRVANWEKIVTTTTDKNPFVPFYPKERKPSSLGTESVLNALVLVNHDVRRVKGGLSAITQQALLHLWEQQQANGAWLWLDFGLRPWEMDSAAYFGTSLAAVTVGTAGKDYYEQAEVQPKVAALKKYLTTQFAKQPLHHRLLGLWASSKLAGILSDADRKQLVEELLSIQEADGGWSVPQLGKVPSSKATWKGHGVYPVGTVSDGYATGLAVLALKSTHLAADHPQLKKATAWLVANQREGTWPVHYPNKARDPQSNVGKFMRDAATAFAILALTEPNSAK